MNSFHTVTKESIFENKEKGSTFKSFLFPALDKEDYQSRLGELKTKYYDASHHCSAYRLGLENVEEFSSDDGEPSGTAGLPIQNQLKSHHLVNVACVVVRYFGGTKLGKSGLIEAYGESARECILKADLKSVFRVKKLNIKYSYELENLLQKIAQTYELIELNAVYTDKVEKEFACKMKKLPSLESELSQLEHLDLEVEWLQEDVLVI